MSEKVKTAINGFDFLVDGGLIKCSITLISSSPGTCKSIFAMQFLNEGIENGPRGAGTSPFLVRKKSNCWKKQNSSALNSERQRLSYPTWMCIQSTSADKKGARS